MRARTGRGAAAALVLALLAWSGSLVAAPPQPLPPPDPGELPGVDETGGELDPVTVEQQREVAFEDHLGRAKRAMQQRRWQEAITEYTAALDIHDGDPEALRGRAQAHKRANPPGRCRRSARSHRGGSQCSSLRQGVPGRGNPRFQDC